MDSGIYDLYKSDSKTCLSDPIQAQEEIRKMKDCSSVQVIKAVDDTSKENGSASIVKQVQYAIWWLIGHYRSLSDEASIEMDIKHLKSVNQSVGDYVLWHEKMIN